MQTTCTDGKCVEPAATMGCCSCQQSSLVIWLAVVTKKMIEFCVDDSFIPLSLLVHVRVNWWLYSVADTNGTGIYRTCHHWLKLHGSESGPGVHVCPQLFSVLCHECSSNVVSYLFQQRPFRSTAMLFDGFHVSQAPPFLQLVKSVSHSSLLVVTYQLGLSATMKMRKLCEINKIIAK